MSWYLGSYLTIASTAWISWSTQALTIAAPYCPIWLWHLSMISFIPSGAASLGFALTMIATMPTTAKSNVARVMKVILDVPSAHRGYFPHVGEGYAELSGNSRRRKARLKGGANCIYLAARQRDVFARGARRFVSLRRSSVSSFCLCKYGCEEPRHFSIIELRECLGQVLG
jgi:hypothetical protein